MQRKDYDFHIRITEELKSKLEQKRRQEGYRTLSELGSVILSDATRDIELNPDTNLKPDAEEEENCVIKITVTKRERELIKSKAQKGNLTVSAFVRKAALDMPVIVLDGFKELVLELSRIGNNLNQLTVLAHLREITSVNLEHTNETLKSVLKEVISLKEKVNKETKVKGRGG